MNTSFSFDVFLSHNSHDKLQVRKLAERLNAKGLKVWFDEWVIQPGDDIYLAIEYGLESSRVLVLCLSSSALVSEWVKLERSTALFRDPSNIGRRFIPLLLDDCKLPDSLRRYAYLDFRQQSDVNFDKLVNACRCDHVPDKSKAIVEIAHDEKKHKNKFNQTTNDESVQDCNKTYSIGDTGPAGGRVFYVDDDSGLHGLEAQPYDLYEHYIDYQRECGLFQKIFSDKPIGLTWNDAVRVIDNYCSGWRIPTKDELNLLYLKKDVLRGFSDTDYWSSTKDNTTIDHGNYSETYLGVWAQDFKYGTQESWGEESIFAVRVVRSF